MDTQYYQKVCTMDQAKKVDYPERVTLTVTWDVCDACDLHRRDWKYEQELDESGLWWLCVVLGAEPRSLSVLSMCSITELHRQPCFLVFHSLSERFFLSKGICMHKEYGVATWAPSPKSVISDSVEAKA